MTNHAAKWEFNCCIPDPACCSLVAGVQTRLNLSCIFMQITLNLKKKKQLQQDSRHLRERERYREREKKKTVEER